MPGDERFQPRDASVVPRFADVATFMRCQLHEISEEIDVGLVGVPFDLGVNYRSGARLHPLMNVVAKTLSDADIDDLVAYYSNIEITVVAPQ